MEKLITVVGTTASGKSDLGIVLAQKFNGEIVSCDSRQIYKGLDLGTGKVTKEEQKLAVHHLIDIKNPNDSFSLAEYQKLAYKAINDILARGMQPFLVGGTGLYSRAVTEGYGLTGETLDVDLRQSIQSCSKQEMIEKIRAFGETVPEDLSPRHLERRLEKLMKGAKNTPNKPKYDYIQLIPVFPRDELYKRIEIRLDKRLRAGMVEEVAALKKAGATDEFLEGLGLEYRYTNRYLNGEYTFEDYREELFKQIRHFAKRQITWFKKEKNAYPLDMTGDFLSEAMLLCKNFLNGTLLP